MPITFIPECIPCDNQRKWRIREYLFIQNLRRKTETVFVPGITHEVLYGSSDLVMWLRLPPDLKAENDHSKKSIKHICFRRYALLLLSGEREGKMKGTAKEEIKRIADRFAFTGELVFVRLLAEAGILTEPICQDIGSGRWGPLR